MKRALTWGILIFLVSYSPALACKDAPPPSIRILPDFSVTGPSQDKSDAELQQAHLASFHPDTQQFVLGRIKTSGMAFRKFTPPHLEMIANISSPDPNGNVCVSIKEVSLNVAISNHIYISPLYPPDSCAYDVTLVHERKHVEITRKVFNKYIALIEEKLPTGLPETASVSVPQSQIEAFKSDLIKNVHIVSDSILQEMEKVMLEEHNKLDTIEEMNANSEACSEFRNPSKAP